MKIDSAGFVGPSRASSEPWIKQKFEKDLVSLSFDLYNAATVSKTEELPDEKGHSPRDAFGHL